MKNRQKKISALLLLTQFVLAGFLTSAGINTVSAAKHSAPAPAAAEKQAEKTSPDSASFNVRKYLTVEEKNQGSKEGKQEQSYLKSANPIASFIIQIINFLILTISSFSFLTIVIGGFTLLTSHGNENQVTKGKDILKYAVTGLIVALAAYFITTFVQSLFYELPQ